jgi:hypothetical protein
MQETHFLAELGLMDYKARFYDQQSSHGGLFLFTG